MIGRIRRAWDELFGSPHVPLNREDGILLGGEILALRVSYIVLLSEMTDALDDGRAFVKRLERRSLETVAAAQLSGANPDLVAKHRRAAEQAIRDNFACFVFGQQGVAWR